MSNTSSLAGRTGSFQLISTSAEPTMGCPSLFGHLELPLRFRHQEPGRSNREEPLDVINCANVTRPWVSTIRLSLEIPSSPAIIAPSG